MSDRFGQREVQLDDPATRHFAITVGQGFAQPTRGIYVGADGDITVEDMDGHAETYYGAKAGSVIPIRATRVTVSTADHLVGMY